MVKKSTLLVFVLLVAFSFALAACSSDANTEADNGAGVENGDIDVENGDAGEENGDIDTENGEAAEADLEDIELTWLVTSNPNREAWYESMAEGFQEENPHVSVEVQIIPGDEVDQRISTMLAGGNAPDVWSPNWAHSGFATYQGMGALLDLTPYIDDEPEILDGFSSDLVDQYNVEGSTYGIPMINLGTFLFYNKDIFDEAGVDYPTTDWNDTSWDWDAMVEKAQELTQDIGDPNNQIFGLHNDKTPNRTSWMFGGDFFTEEAYETGNMGEPQAAANPANHEAIQAQYDLIHTHEVSPNPAQLDAVSQIGNPFLTGRVAMIIDGGWGTMTFAEAEFDWGMAAVPYGSEDRVVPRYVDPWSISHDSDHPDEAWEFIKYLIDIEKGGLEYVEMVKNAPADERLLDDWYDIVLENADMTFEELQEVVEGSMEYGRGSDNHLIGGFASINTAINQTIDGIYSNSMSVEEGLETIDENLRSLDLNE